MHRLFRFLVSGSLAALLWVSTGSVQAQIYVNGSVAAALPSGIYGRIDIGQAPPPPLLYAQPIVVQHPVMVVPQEPVYLYVPRDHAKHWRKHCRQYQACGQPVYFLRDRPQHAQWHRDDKHYEKSQKRYEKDQERAYKHYAKAQKREHERRGDAYERREKERERAHKRHAKQQDRRDHDD